MVNQMKIIEIRMLSCQFSINPDKTDDDRNIEISLQTAKGFNETTRVAVCKLKAHNIDTDKPYNFMVEYGGQFLLDEDEAKNADILKRLQDVNMPGIIYPFLRELLADLSRRSGINPVVLPPTNFVELAHQANECEQ